MKFCAINTCECQICKKVTENLKFLCLYEESKIEIFKLKEQIELLKNKENIKCIHGIEKHIECNICAHNVELKIKCLECEKINSKNLKEKEEKGFDFMTAVKYLKEGKKVKRKKWDKLHLFKRFDEELICFQYDDDNINDDLKFTIEELYANDWELC